MSTKQEILGALALHKESVDLGGGVVVTIQEFDYERGRAYSEAVKGGTKPLVALLMFGCVNDDGDLIFSEAEAEVLGKSSFLKVQKITGRIMEISGMVDGTEKNV